MRFLNPISIGVIAIITSYSTRAGAQDQETWHLMNKIRDANKVSVISYDYKIYRRDANSHKALDSIVGRLYKKDSEYLDSNRSAITAVIGGFYCKLNNIERTATVFDVAALKKKINLKTPDASSAIIALPDSIIRKYGKISIQNENKGIGKMTVLLEGPFHTSLSLEYDQQSYLIRSVKMITKVTKEDDMYETAYSMNNFNRVIAPGVFNYSRFFTLNTDKKTVLSGKYAGYKLDTITK